jgi:hypothetical protein
VCPRPGNSIEGQAQLSAQLLPFHTQLKLSSLLLPGHHLDQTGNCRTVPLGFNAKKPGYLVTTVKVGVGIKTSAC